MARRIGWTIGLTLLASAGCVQRTMRVISNPPGAIVWMNDQEIGRTPLERDFTWYGNYDVQVRADGYEPLDTTTSVVAPWWQWPPIDLVAELMPFRPRDVRTISYTLKPATTQPAEPSVMLTRAAELRGMMQSTEFTRKPAPTSQPATRAIQPAR